MPVTTKYNRAGVHCTIMVQWSLELRNNYVIVIQVLNYCEQAWSKLKQKKSGMSYLLLDDEEIYTSQSIIDYITIY